MGSNSNKHHDSYISHQFCTILCRLSGSSHNNPLNSWKHLRSRIRDADWSDHTLALFCSLQTAYTLFFFARYKNNYIQSLLKRIHTLFYGRLRKDRALLWISLRSLSEFRNSRLLLWTLQRSNDLQSLLFSSEAKDLHSKLAARFVVGLSRCQDPLLET